MAVKEEKTEKEEKIAKEEKVKEEKKEKVNETKESVKEIYEGKDNKKEEFFEEEKRSVVGRIINIFVWIILIAWVGICLFDFYNTKTGKKPVFCLKKETTTYNDGYVNTCTGLGYKIFNYRRTSFNGDEYGPFWSKDRTADKK